MIAHSILSKKVHISAQLQFETAFHIGSGQEGETATDMGVLLDQESGQPILPGSSLKGKFRATAERLAIYLGMQACLLDSSLSGLNCVSDEIYRKKVYEQFKNKKTEKEKLDWLENNLCDVCKLFGSPLHGSRIFFSDAFLMHWSGRVEIRDGVSLDRDSEIARSGMKYDFEVVPAGSRFKLVIDLENPDNSELALVGAVISEWKQGLRLGGITSRGLGLAFLQDIEVNSVDFNVPEQRNTYLVEQKMNPAPELLSNALKSCLQGGQAHA